MAEPINYWNPQARSDANKPASSDRPLAAMPVEFDSLVTRTTELAAAGAIVRALKKAQIPLYQSDDGNIANREILLYVKASDQSRAATIAAEIFARRKKIKSLPRQKPAPATPTVEGLDFTSFML